MVYVNMKLDNDPGSRLPTTPARKSYNPFDSDDDSPKTMTADGFTKDINTGFVLKDYEATPDSLAEYANHADDFSWEEAILGQPTVDNDAINKTPNRHGVVFDKEAELYTDKTVTECELPEFVVCYKENAYQSVKDIGIDEGLPLPDKIWVKGREDMDLPTLMDPNGGSPTDSVSDRLSVREGSQSKAAVEALVEDSAKIHASDIGAVNEEYPSHQSETDNAVKSNVMKHDPAENPSFPDLSSKGAAENQTSNIVSDSTNSPENISEMDASERRDSDLLHKHQTSHDVVQKGGETHDSDEEGSEANTMLSVLGLDPKDLILPPKVSDEGEEKVSSFQSASEEATLSEYLEFSTVDESASSSKNKALLYDSKIESGSITFDFNSSNLSASPETAQEKNTERERAPQSQTMTRDGGGATAALASISELEERGEAETSFSAIAEPASITYLGPVVNSGNISLRSESSAGSTHSFAFPVLQTDCISSPVKMAKAEQRHFRRHRGIGWVQSLICCRF